jgi:hypothetical protein
LRSTAASSASSENAAVPSNDNTTGSSSPNCRSASLCSHRYTTRHDTHAQNDTTRHDTRVNRNE